MKSFLKHKKSIILVISSYLIYNSIHYINYNELGIIENYKSFYFGKTYKLLTPSVANGIFLEQPFATVIKIPRNNLTLEMVYTLNDGKKLYVKVSGGFNITFKAYLKCIFNRSIDNCYEKNNQFLKQYIDSIIKDDFLNYYVSNTEEEKRDFLHKFWTSETIKEKLCKEGLNVKELIVIIF